MNKNKCLLSIAAAFAIVFTSSAADNFAKAENDGFVKAEPLSEYKTVAEDNGITLNACTADGKIYITDVNSGLSFYSNPQNAEANTNLKGANRMLAQSQLMLTLADNSGNQISVNSAAGSVNKSGLAAYLGENKVKFVYFFPEYNIEIPIVYALESGRLTAAVTVEDIKSEDKDLMLREIRLLPYFGAASSEDDGYILVPDGCGAVIDFNSAQTPAYKQGLYGDDRGKDVKTISENTQPALIPAAALSYSSYNGHKAALIMYAEQGDALASVNADAASTDGCYNTASFDFLYRNYDSVTFMDRTSSAKSVLFNEKSHVAKGEFKVSYTVLSGKNSIADIAGVVRNRVFDGFEQNKTENSTLPVYVRAFMSVRKTKYFLGIPYNGSCKLTDLDDCADIMDSFNGVPVIMSLIGTDSDGASGGHIDKGFKLKDSIGSLKQLKQITDDAEKAGGAIYPSAEFTELTKGNRNNRVKSVANLTVKRPYFDYGILKEKTDYNAVYMLNSLKISENVRSWIKSAKKHGINSSAPISLSNSPYRSGSKAGCDRQSTADIFENALNEFKNNDISLMLESAAAYALPYASHIRSLPVSSSGYAAESSEVPFLQLVLHGVKSYSMPSVNLSGNWKKAFLKAVETGSSLDFTFIASDYSVIKGTPLDVINGSEWRLWKDTAAETAKKLADYMKDTVNSYITDYRIISKDVRAVCYENGGCFIINYGETDYSIGDITVKAESCEKVDKGVLK